MAPVSFIHASHLCLDAPLHVPDGLPESARNIVRRATITAFERLVTAALERRVDFVLLAGETFVEDDRSLRARVELLAGLRRLDDAGIPVVAVPGEADPADAWRSIPELPPNVIILDQHDEEPVEVDRDGKPVARIRWIRQDAAARSTDCVSIGLLRRAGDSPEPIASEAFDYVALCDAEQRATHRNDNQTMHGPGRAQGLRFGDEGAHGASFVKVDADRRVQTSFIGLAPVRWESCELSLARDAGEKDLPVLMARELAGIRPEPHEDLCLIQWTVRGEGEVLELLDDPILRTALLEEAVPDAKDAAAVHHTFRLLPTPAAPRAGRFAAMNLEFASAFDAAPQSLDEVARELLDAAEAVEPAGAAWLQKIASGIDRERILTRARHVGETWFSDAGPEEVGA